ALVAYSESVPRSPAADLAPRRRSRLPLFLGVASVVAITAALVIVFLMQREPLGAGRAEQEVVASAEKRLAGGEVDQALAECDSAVKQWGGRATVRLLRAKARLVARNYDGAIEDCDAASSESPVLASALRSRALLGRGDWKGAGDAAELALQADP